MDKITVFENGRELVFTYADIINYHGHGFPGGVVQGIKAMQAGFALLGSEIERRDVSVTTAFGGPGGRDSVEVVTRALTDGRYIVDNALSSGNVIDNPPGPYVWRFTYRGTTVDVRIKPGHVREEFVRLGAKADRSAEEIECLEALKIEMADRLLVLGASEIYDAKII